MIKRIIGVLFTLGAVAVMVFAVMNFGNYRSMLFKPHDRTTIEPVDTADSLHMAVEEPLQRDASEAVEEGTREAARKDGAEAAKGDSAEAVEEPADSQDVM